MARATKQQEEASFPEMGANLKDARERVGMTQADLSHETGASISSIQRWEAGAMPSRRWWPAIEEVLDIDKADIVEASANGRPRTAEELAALRAEIAELKKMIARLL